MNILANQSDATGISVQHIAEQFHISLQSNDSITSIIMSSKEFHELVYQCLRAQEREILNLIKLSEKTIEEIGDVTKLWKS